MTIERFNPDGMYKPPYTEENRKYSHVVTTDADKQIHIAGLVARNEDGELVGEGDMAKQTQTVRDNLDTALREVGCDNSDLFRINILTTDIKAYMAQGHPYMIHWYDGEGPASTTWEVSSLAEDRMLVEMNATAELETSE